MSGHEDRERWFQAFTDGFHPEDFFGPIYSAMPETFFALFVVFCVGFSLYTYVDSSLPLVILLAMFGGIIIMALPPQAAIVAVIVVGIGFAAALYTVWRDR